MMEMSVSVRRRVEEDSDLFSGLLVEVVVMLEEESGS